jgi:hypothetical protein
METAIAESVWGCSCLVARDWHSKDRFGGLTQFFDKVRSSLGALCFLYQATALLASAIAPWWYSSRLRLIHHSQELAMELFPRDRHRFPGLQVFHSSSYFLVPCLLNRLIRRLKTIEQRVSQCGALVDREGECSS